MSVAGLDNATLNQWVARQRWYAGKGSDPVLRPLGFWSLPGGPDVRVSAHLVMDESSDPPTLYQIPVSSRRERIEGRDSALIGIVSAVGGDEFVYDGAYDAVFAEQLLRMIVRQDETVGGDVGALGLGSQSFDFDVVESHVLGGEQSNTSIVFTLTAAAASPSGPRSVVCKVFRALHDGTNPDVELQSALSEAGSARVPASVGSVWGEWPDAGQPSGRARGHLAFAQEFLAHATDAWTEALNCARDGIDFSSHAHEIGMATAEVHRTLAGAFPTESVGAEEIARIRAAWDRRRRLAADAVPALTTFRPSIEKVYEAAGGVSWPALQRVHGDLHLGQVLITPEGRCVLIDFEGEPLRPMHERSVADAPLRDVAGMLRSFDYVAGTRRGAPGASAWSQTCRAAFSAGYSESSGIDLASHQVLLDAFEADKAVYEAIYESRNRPDWLNIPTEAIGRLAERVG